MAREQAIEQKPFVKILADGSFRLEVPEGTEGSQKRDYEVDGVKGTKNEIVYNNITGTITNVDIVDTKFGDLIQVTVTDEEGDLIISTSTSGNFGSDIMKKLPGMDFSKMYKFTPYSFIPEGKDNPLKGVSIMNDMEEKITSFFWDSKKEEAVNGIPVPEKDKSYTKNQWKSYFGQVEDFLIDYTKTNIVSKFNKDEEDGDF